MNRSVSSANLCVWSSASYVGITARHPRAPMGCLPVDWLGSHDCQVSTPWASYIDFHVVEIKLRRHHVHTGHQGFVYGVSFFSLMARQ